MQLGSWTKRAVVAAALLTAGASWAADEAAPTDVAAELKALKARIAELEAKEGNNWLTQERAAQIKSIVQDVLKDAQTRGQGPGGMDIGYKDGFYIQSADKNYKLVIGGFVQIRYEAALQNAFNGRTTPPRSAGGGTNNVPGVSQGNSSGIDIRRARINLSGNIFSENLTYRLEGDFYGNASGNFTVTDAFVAYRFNDQFKVKFGSFKVPFAKAELTSDTVGTFAERPEELFPFDPVRSLGVSLYGDIIKDKLSYDVNMNDGSQANTLRRDDTNGITPNLDNRLAFYARMQYAGNGKIADFAEESDMRVDNRDYIWMVGAAGGYESQNGSNSAFPSPQQTGTVPGLPNGTGNNFPYGSPYVLNGDIFRGTIDYSAKYHGVAINTAAYIQQVNANPGTTNVGTSGGNPSTTGPFGAGNSSFFQWGTYAQVGYFVIPQKLELTGRAGLIATEGFPDMGDFYSVGANYYVFGNNFKIQSDVTYVPEAAYSDSASSTLANTHDVIFRLQVQLKF